MRVSTFGMLLGLSLPIVAAPTLDTTFAVNGIIERSLAGNAGEADGVVALADGTLLASGFYWHPYRGFRVYASTLLERYDRDGSRVITPLPFFPKIVQRDGKMITISQTGLKRVNPDGVPDTGYVLDGAASIPWFADMSQVGFAGMALQGDGKVVVAGNSAYSVVLVRFNTDGSLDTTFNYVGALIASHGDSDIDETTNGLVVQPDGKIVVAASSLLGLAPRLTLLRFNADGSPDAAFGNNGRVSIPIESSNYVSANRLVRQPNGRLVLLGSKEAMRMVGFRPLDGAVDTTFGTAGVVDIPIQGSSNGVNVDEAIATPDGTILVAFSTYQASNRLMRFTPDGTPDNAFGTSGTFSSSQLPIVTKVALLPDGDLALGGTTAGGNFGLGRVSSGPSPAIEFYNATLDHYFLSINPQEVADLDLGVHVGWKRSGQAFSVYGSGAAAVAAGIVSDPACRFYIPPQHGDSHFFSIDPAECVAVANKVQTEPNYSGYVYETANAFYATLPDSATGACPVAMVPVYRLWNQRADSNHRYTTDPVIKAQMLAKGYIAEGNGPDAVAMCAPQ